MLYICTNMAIVDVKGLIVMLGDTQRPTVDCVICLSTRNDDETHTSPGPTLSGEDDDRVG